MAPPAKKAKAQSGPGLTKFFGKSQSEGNSPSAPATAEAPAASEPVAAPVATSTPAAAPAAGARTLSEEQLKRIEENKRKALEKRAQKRNLEGDTKESPATTQSSATSQPAAPSQAESSSASQPAANSQPQASSAAAAQPPLLPGVANVHQATNGTAAPQQEASSPTKKEAVASVATTPASPGPAKTPNRAAGKMAALFAKPAASPAKPASSPSKAESPAAPESTPQRPPTPGRTPASKGTPEKPLLPPERRSPLSGGGKMSTNRVASARQGCPAEQTDRFNNLGDKVGSWMQFNDLYNLRLEKLRDGSVRSAKTLWANGVRQGGFLPDMSGLSRGKGQQIVVVGIIFREMPSRPNIIEKYSNHKALLNAKCDDQAELIFNSDKDSFWIEDRASSRIRLELPPGGSDILVTGLVCAMKGTVTEDGSFKATAWCFPSPTSFAPAVASQSKEGSGHFIAFISGLGFGGSACDAELRKRAADFLAGRCEDPERKALADGVQRLVVCGGTVDREASTNDAAVAALAEADIFFSEIAATLPVDVMPGRGDPSTLSLPQDPLSPHFFREARGYKDFRSVRNPYEASLGGMKILGHSGQPIQDILRCSKLPSALEALKLCFEARHLAPTAPDTLSSQPFRSTDPFIIDTSPHLLFSGCHDAVAHSWQPSPSDEGLGTQCLCVPAFAKQASLVLVNMRDAKDVRVVNFAGAVGGA